MQSYLLDHSSEWGPCYHCASGVNRTLEGRGKRSRASLAIRRSWWGTGGGRPDRPAAGTGSSGYHARNQGRSANCPRAGVRGRGLRQGKVPGGTYQRAPGKGFQRRGRRCCLRARSRGRGSLNPALGSLVEWNTRVLFRYSRLLRDFLRPLSRVGGPGNGGRAAPGQPLGGDCPVVYQLYRAPHKPTHSGAAAVALTSSLGGFSGVFPNSPMAN